MLLLLLAIIAAIAVVAAGGGGGLEPAEPDRRPTGALPVDGPVTREAVDRLRFSLAFRGYRMDEVDEVLDRLAGELEARDARIAELETALASGHRRG